MAVNAEQFPIIDSGNMKKQKYDSTEACWECHGQNMCAMGKVLRKLGTKKTYIE